MEQKSYNTSNQNSGRVHTSDSSDERSKEGWRDALSTILILILAPVVAILLTTFVFQSYEVDGPSMENTLQNRDRLIVWKVPRTISRVTHHAYIPGRGDIIIFNRKDTSEFGSQSEKQLIKRVIALPGERIVIHNGAITIYNHKHRGGFNPDLSGEYDKIKLYTQGTIDLTVPTGQVFVAGDNRGNSLDSRIFGTVPANDIVGSLSIRIFPFNKVKTF